MRPTARRREYALHDAEYFLCIDEGSENLPKHFGRWLIGRSLTMNSSMAAFCGVVAPQREQGMSAAAESAKDCGTCDAAMKEHA
jgi:hypothetical protein